MSGVIGKGLAAAVVLAGLAVAWAVRFDAPDAVAEIDRATTRGSLDETPGVPLALPAVLPPHYRWLGPASSGTDQSGMTIVRSSMFVHEPMATAPSVEVCVQTGHRDRCAHGNVRLERRLRTGETVFISFDLAAPSARTLDWWRTVDLNVTANPRWLR